MDYIQKEYFEPLGKSKHGSKQDDERVERAYQHVRGIQHNKELKEEEKLKRLYDYGYYDEIEMDDLKHFTKEERKFLKKTKFKSKDNAQTKRDSATIKDKEGKIVDQRTVSIKNKETVIYKTKSGKLYYIKDNNKIYVTNKDKYKKAFE